MHMVRFHAKTKEQAFKTLFSCVLVTGLINFTAVVLLHTLEAKKHVKILLAINFAFNLYMELEICW